MGISRNLISEKEIKVVSVLENFPKSSITAISKQSKVKPANVQYLLQKLRDKKLLSVTPVVNSYALGIQNIAVFFTPAIKDKDQLAKFLSIIKANNSIRWCREFIGDVQFGLSIHCKHIKKVNEVLNKITETSEVTLFEKIISARTSYTRFSRGYLSLNASKVLFSHYYPENFVEIDSLDTLILQAFTRKRCQSNREVARQLGEASSTIDRRIEILKEKNIISGYVANIASELFGRVRYRLMISTNQLGTKNSKIFNKYCANIPESISLNETLGYYDRELIIEALNQEDVARIIREILQANRNKITSIKALGEGTKIKYELI